MTIAPADLDDPRVVALLRRHLSAALAATPPGSAHALDVSGLRAPDIEVWASWAGERLVGVVALKRLDARRGEVKSMHVDAASRRAGAGGALLRHLVDAARRRGMTRLYLETGATDYFLPARALYVKHGFVACGPFGSYGPDPNSVFMTLDLGAAAPD